MREGDPQPCPMGEKIIYPLKTVELKAFDPPTILFGGKNEEKR
jgi:hypothetical protein